MATQPDINPDTINPGSPDEMPPDSLPDEAPMQEPPGSSRPSRTMTIPIAVPWKLPHRPIELARAHPPHYRRAA